MRSGRRIGFLWTREAIIYAIDLWHRQHLETPSVEDWATAGENHPTYVTVMRRFGSWNNAIRAAGFRPRPPGVARGQTRADRRSRPMPTPASEQS